ncbi:zinc-binding dehydrogenase [Inquilinus limosus]|uniref:zinc-binding dehydrogenase n=1 Tax=Inquilinus limosus TaxID=171674 RepID=UPI003F5CF8C3
MRQTAGGVNFLDVYFRNGDLAVAGFPFVNGFEAAGVIEAVGPGVDGVAPGERVGYQLVGGAYADARLMAPDRLVHLAEAVDDTTAASGFLKGMTAEYLVRRVHTVRPADIVLIHAAAGGTGSIIAQWSKHLGAMVIGTEGSSQKREAALAAGCDHVIVNADEDFAARILELTDGRGATVAYDGIGQATFRRNFEVLRPMGKAVSFGWVSGRVGPIDIDALQAKSLAVVSPSLADQTRTRE